ncbi:MAG: SEC-C domain-containing protein, partial [Pyrinomonadaceae bacterium]|nr:SEC-C domain-containing protein [Pyrinomonadaceae bacterium]
DMISDVETWHCFRDPAGYRRENETPPLKSLPDFKLGESVFWESEMEGTFARETPKVGKNEPCPCGSGRKYKKCCMN